MSADDFFYTNLGGDIHVENVNDGLDFGATCNAFSLLNISENEQREIFKVVAALLHLGNVKFCKKSRRAEDAAIQVKNKIKNLYYFLVLERRWSFSFGVMCFSSRNWYTNASKVAMQ